MIRKHYKGDILYYEGNSLDGYLFLSSGSVKAFKYSGENEVFLYSLSDGLISDVGGVALSTVEFLEDSEVLHIDDLTMRDLIDESQKRLMLINESFNIMCYSAIEKVVYFLLKKDFNSFKNCDIAMMLNISSETLSRVLSKLQKQGFISRVADVQILDRDALLGLLL